MGHTPFSLLVLGNGDNEGNDDCQCGKGPDHTAGHNAPMMSVLILLRSLLTCTS